MDWVKDSVQAGLYKRQRDNDDVWAVKARIKGGKPITHTIGKSSLFTPQQARNEAKRILALLAQGINPRDERKKQELIQRARNLTLGSAIDEYSKIATWKDKTRTDALSTLKRRFEDWYTKPLASITKAQCQARFIKIKEDVSKLKEVRDSLREKDNRKIKAYDNEIGLGEAQRAFRYLSAIFNSYIQDDAGTEKLLPNGNPCLILKAKKLRKALKPRERFLDEKQRNILYDTLASATSSDYPGSIKTDDADLIWLLIHTGLRLDEALSMPWSAVDFTKQTFTAYDTKNHKNHTLPFTDATKAMFERRQASSSKKPFVFTSPVSDKEPMTASRTFQRVSEEVGFDFTAHDLRRTVATVASELGYDLNSIGMVLNHAKKGVTSGYVQQTHKRLREILINIQDALFNIPKA